MLTLPLRDNQNLHIPTDSYFLKKSLKIIEILMLLA